MDFSKQKKIKIKNEPKVISNEDIINISRPTGRLSTKFITAQQFYINDSPERISKDVFRARVGRKMSDSDIQVPVLFEKM